MSDLCHYCNGTGERDWLSGAPCYECGGTGWIEDIDDDERYVGFGSCQRCGCDLDDDHPGDLCDQCEWWVEQNNA